MKPRATRFRQVCERIPCARSLPQASPIANAQSARRATAPDVRMPPLEHITLVIPAKAGIQRQRWNWIPAFAGMTKGGLPKEPNAEGRLGTLSARRFRLTGGNPQTKGPPDAHHVGAHHDRGAQRRDRRAVRSGLRRRGAGERLATPTTPLPLIGPPTGSIEVSKPPATPRRGSDSRNANLPPNRPRPSPVDLESIDSDGFRRARRRGPLGVR